MIEDGNDDSEELVGEAEILIKHYIPNTDIDHEAEVVLPLTSKGIKEPGSVRLQIFMLVCIMPRQ